MRQLTDTELDMVAQYEKNFDEYEKAAKLLGEYLETHMMANKVLFHTIEKRAKSVDSLRRKFRRTKRRRRLSQIHDLVAARVIVCFRSDAIRAESVLKRHFKIVNAHSENKGLKKKYGEFGYTSIHCVCKATHATEDLRLQSLFSHSPFEIQIRSVLEHGWAEIEHEVVYKANTEFPKIVRRRFAMLAAALEAADIGFEQLRMSEIKIILSRVSSVPLSTRKKLDRSWLIAVLEHSYPDHPSWSPHPHENAFYPHLDLDLLEICFDIGIDTVGKWKKAVEDNWVRVALANYAFKKGIENPQHVSHFPIACSALYRQLPLGYYPRLRELVDGQLAQTWELLSQQTFV